MTRAPIAQAERCKVFSISDLCVEFDVTPRTLRFYEQKGLLAPAKRGWTRLFSQRDRVRLQLILRGKRVGLSLEEIKEIIDLYHLKDGHAEQLKVAADKLRGRLNTLKKQRKELDDTITELERTCSIVEGMLKEKKSLGADAAE
ncbi:DNA-binding transcriptional MerR regulator [Rhodoligotrophos appendicifer]|uniref:MerR family transcriptional regulator n=1 Tax=Rhodoligotrophos appendicifer TaxID=987056 RepID=UPI0011871817|nr:MerR family DNA-binding transcriptional regulator [Rhodoligotrophos appendicifer]